MSRWDGFEELVEVVNSGSFSAAAIVLGVSKGHVSQQISRLEDRLGVRLLHRTTRKLSLTEAGEMYYTRCQQVVEDLEATEASVSELQVQIQGPLRISAPHLLGEKVLVPALAEFQRQNPALDVELNLSSRKIDLIEEHCDVAIQVGERKDINVVNHRLTATDFHLVASPGYLKQHGRPKKPADLKQHNCLLFVENGTSKPWKFRSDNGTVSVRVKSTWRSNSGHVLRGAAEQGLGLAYLPDYYLEDELKTGKLEIVLSDWQSIEREIVAIYLNKRHLSMKLRMLTEFLAADFAKQ